MRQDILTFYSISCIMHDIGTVQMQSPVPERGVAMSDAADQTDPIRPFHFMHNSVIDHTGIDEALSLLVKVEGTEMFPGLTPELIESTKYDLHATRELLKQVRDAVVCNLDDIAA